MHERLDPEPFKVLEPARNVNYGREELPSPKDHRIRELLAAAASRATFTEVRDCLPPKADQVLGAFAERAASLAVRERSMDDLRTGLFAAALAQAASADERDVLPALALLYRAAERIGAEPAVEFASAAERYGRGADSLARFIRRAPEDRTPEAMGFEEVNDGKDFTFVCTW
ncbi:hypothetical protein ACGFI9_14410 [Micromonospora sp. NPDC048930]|uniref:hypothetical protein n=1 Tax=Micromonospora sp. NPDC048930 TaxID=3364261 RepID=UPI003714FEA2